MQLSGYEEGPIKADDIDTEVFVKALLDGLINHLDSEMEEQNMQEIIIEFGKKISARNKELSLSNREISNAFFKENANKEGIVTTPSGLQYKVLTPSNGRHFDAKVDGIETEACITYEGRMLNGAVFDQSDDPINIALNGVIPGLSEALQLMPEGAEWEIYIPSELAYGEHGPGTVEASAAVIFRVKLHYFIPHRSSNGSPIEFTPEMLQQLEDAGLRQSF